MQKNDYHNATGLQTGGIVNASNGELLYNAFYYTEEAGYDPNKGITINYSDWGDIWLCHDYES